MSTPTPYTIVDSVSLKPGTGKDSVTDAEKRLKSEGCEFLFIHTHKNKSDPACKSFQVYRHPDGRHFVIKHEFSKRRGQLFDSYLCEIKVHDGFTAV